MSDEPIHVMPVDDLIEHEYVDCVCGPTVEPIEHDDGSITWLYVHDSLDGRELHEPDRATT